MFSLAFMDNIDDDLSVETLPLEQSNGLILDQTYISPFAIQSSICTDISGKLTLSTTNSVFKFDGIGFTKDIPIQLDKITRIAFVKLGEIIIIIYMGRNILWCSVLYIISLQCWRSNCIRSGHGRTDDLA